MEQKQAWNNIASEWFKFRKEPIKIVTGFLKKQKGKILDLGGGSGRHLMKIKKGKMYLVDFSEEMLKLAKKKAKQKNIEAEFIISEITKLPFQDNFFDSTICIGSLHCIKGKANRTKVVKEIFRVLKPKAQALVLVWNKETKRFKNSPKERYTRWRDKGPRYYYLFNEKEIHDLFKKAGFKIKKSFTPEKNIVFIIEKS